MITPKEFIEAINGPKNNKLFAPSNPYTNYDRFMDDVNEAEKKAVSKFRDAVEDGQSPKKLRVRVNVLWDESLVRRLIDEYRSHGWSDVSYNKDDYGFREPQGEWIITIKIPEQC